MRKQRLTGVDLVKGIAAFDVVFIHSLGSLQAQNLDSLPFGFAVPFFLAASFYFSINKLYETKEYPNLKSRSLRLLMPYLVWTCIYILARVTKYFLLKQTDEMQRMFLDPFGLLFFGGSSLQLYYLPLLFVGETLLVGAAYLIRKHTNIFLYLFILVLSLFASQIVYMSGNSFDLASKTAFANFFPHLQTAPIIRILLVWASWIIRCLPYASSALLLGKLYPNLISKKFNWISTFLYLVMFISLEIYGTSFMPIAVAEASIAYAALMLGIALSSFLSPSLLITSLGICSYGIYLIHALVIEIVDLLAKKVTFLHHISADGSYLSVFLISGVSFAASWFIVAVASRNKSLSQSVFGT